MNPSSNRAPFAAIDLGSNTVRLLVASAEGGGMDRLIQRQETTRLGQGLKPGERLLPEAVARTWRVLEDYRRSIEAAGAGRTLVGATMAVREAADGMDFISRIGRELGFETEVLTGEMEAETAAAGVLTVLDPAPEQVLIFDLGGRSTEFVLLEGQDPQRSVSLSMGAVALTESHLRSDPPTALEISICRDDIRRILTDGLRSFRENGLPGTVVGTAGTVTTMAAMAQKMTVYERGRIDNFRLTRDVLDRLIETMVSRSTAERAKLPGLPPDRADVIPAGAFVVSELMEYIGINHIIVCDAGLLEGIWLAAAGRRSIRRHERKQIVA